MLESLDRKPGAYLCFVLAGLFFCVLLLIYKWPRSVAGWEFMGEEIEQIEVYQPLPYQYQRPPDILISEGEEIEKWRMLLSECRLSYCGSRSKYFYWFTGEAVVFVLKNGERWDIYREGEYRINTPKGYYEAYGEDREKLTEFWRILEEVGGT